MATLTKLAITAELEEAFREADTHGTGCRCCEAVATKYRRHRYFSGVPFRVAIRETMTRMASEYLAGKVATA